MKALRVATTIMDTYAAATKVYAEVPFPANIAASALVIAKGIMNLAMIKAQKFHTGGFVDRKTANKEAMGGLRNDEIPAILQKGEYVLSRQDVEAIKNIGQPNVNVTAPTPEVVIVNAVDQSVFEDYLVSRQGREVIRNIVGK